jgi:hypothetical protein
MADSILERILAMDVLAILLWIKEGAYSRIYLGVNSLSNKVIFPTCENKLEEAKDLSI